MRHETLDLDDATTHEEEDANDDESDHESAEAGISLTYSYLWILPRYIATQELPHLQVETSHRLVFYLYLVTHEYKSQSKLNNFGIPWYKGIPHWERHPSNAFTTQLEVLSA